MISLVMLSGGIDSTYVLAKLLRDTDDEILVHHIHMVNNSNRHIPEKEACDRIVEYCRAQYRPFVYTQSAIDRRRFATHGPDVLSAGFEAGNVSASFYVTRKEYVDRWFIGHCVDDLMPRRRAKHAQDFCEYNCQAGNAPELYLFSPIGLQEQVAYLGVDLFDLTWSCRAPKMDGETATPCGTCQACRRRAAVSVPSHSAGMPLQIEALPWPMVLRQGEQRAREAALRQVV